MTTEMEHARERRLFECLHARNGRHPETGAQVRVALPVLQDGLSHALCSNNAAVSARAARELARITSAPVVVRGA